jgi:hypothetical protein
MSQHYISLCDDSTRAIHNGILHGTMAAAANDLVAVLERDAVTMSTLTREIKAGRGTPEIQDKWRRTHQRVGVH